jgi:hypothetical protein
MKKKSTSQSAFFNLRIVVGFNIFLVGIFLALFAAANPSDADELALPRQPAQARSALVGASCSISSPASP